MKLWFTTYVIFFSILRIPGYQVWQKMFDTVEAVLDFYGVARTLIQRVLQHLYREDMLTIPQPSQNVPDKHRVSTLHS